MSRLSAAIILLSLISGSLGMRTRTHQSRRKSSLENRVTRSNCYTVGNADLTCGECVTKKTYLGGEDCVWCVERNDFLKRTGHATANGVCQTRGTCHHIGASWGELVPDNCIGIGIDGAAGHGIGYGAEMCTHALQGTRGVKMGGMRWPIDMSGSRLTGMDVMSGIDAAMPGTPGIGGAGHVASVLAKITLDVMNSKLAAWEHDLEGKRAATAPDQLILERRRELAKTMLAEPAAQYNLLLYTARAPVAEQDGYEELRMRECPDSNGEVSIRFDWDGGNSVWGSTDTGTLATSKGERYHMETALWPNLADMVGDHVNSNRDSSFWANVAKSKRRTSNKELWKELLQKDGIRDWCSRGAHIADWIGHAAVAKALWNAAEAVERTAREHADRVLKWHQSREYVSTWEAQRGYVDELTLEPEPPHVLGRRWWTYARDTPPYRPYMTLTSTKEQRVVEPLGHYEIPKTQPTTNRTTFKMTTTKTVVMRFDAGDGGIETRINDDWILDMDKLAQDLAAAIDELCPVGGLQPKKSWGYKKVAGQWCGAADSTGWGGSCGSSNQLEIGPGGVRFSQASRATAMEECGKICDQHWTCQGFNFVEAEGLCYFRKDTTCEIKADPGRDCYTKRAAIEDRTPMRAWWKRPQSGKWWPGGLVLGYWKMEGRWCGAADSAGWDGPCGKSNQLYIGPGASRYSQASRAIAMEECGKLCDQHSECGAFNFVESDGRCYFRKRWDCEIKVDPSRDCYVKEAIDRDGVDF